MRLERGMGQGWDLLVFSVWTAIVPPLYVTSSLLSLHRQLL